MNTATHKKIYIKELARKTLGLISALLIVLFPAFASAATTFNSDSQDYSTVLVSNATKNPGCTTCWSTSVSADAGDVISFLVYYHNTGSETAHQTRVGLTLPNGQFTSASIQGRVSAANASTVYGSATVNLSSSQSLSFIPGSVRWYPNQTSSNPQNPPFGQNGSEVVGSSGLNLGDIAAGWPAQGHVIFRIQVSSSQSQQGSLPIVTTNSASVAQSSANLMGTVNPNGIQTNAWFEYGTTQSLGQTIGYQTVGSAIGSQSINASLSGLYQNTTYYYRAVAQNQYGTVYGSILSFTTSSQFGGQGLPTITTLSSSYFTGQSFATLNGSVNPNGSATTAWFEYGTTYSLGQTAGSQFIGSSNSSMTFSGSIPSLFQNTTYYYRAVAQNQFGTVYGSILSFNSGQTNLGGYGAPNVVTNSPSSISQSYVTFNGTVNPNNNQTNAWFEYGFNSSLGQTVGFQALGSSNSNINYSYSVSSLVSNTTYYYRAVSQNSQGTSYGSILSFTTQSGGGGMVYGSQPTVTTISPSVIHSNVAVLSGKANPNGLFTNAWFEWGTTPSLGRTAGQQNVGSDTAQHDLIFVLSGLSSNTPYYFRVVAQNTQGTVYGNIVSFTTQPIAVTATPTSPIVITPSTPGTTGVSINSSVNVDNPAPGDDMTYTITYKNGTNATLRDGVIRVVLPSEIEFISANEKISSQNANSIVFTVGTLSPQSQDTVSIKVRVNSSVEDRSVLIFASTLEYTNGAGAFKTVSSYLSVTVKGAGNLFGAFIGQFGGFFGPLILVLLLVAVALYVVYRYMFKSPPHVPLH